jgi:hypothetical protein
LTSTVVSAAPRSPSPRILLGTNTCLVSTEVKPDSKAGREQFASRGLARCLNDIDIAMVDPGKTP